MIKQALGAAGLTAMLAGLVIPTVAAADSGDGPTEDGTGTSVNTPSPSQSDDIVSPPPAAATPTPTNTKRPDGPAEDGPGSHIQLPSRDLELPFGAGTIIVDPPWNNTNLVDPHGATTAR